VKEFMARPSPEIDAEHTLENEENKCSYGQDSDKNNQAPLCSEIDGTDNDHGDYKDRLAGNAPADPEKSAHFPPSHSKVSVNIPLHGDRLPAQYKCVHGYPDTTKRMAQQINQINAPIRIEIPIPVRSAPWVNTLASMIAVRPTAAIAQTQ
jgi:hypothetical protein